MPVGKLTVAQDAVIAAMIQQPSTYPLPQYRAQLAARWHYVLDGMVADGQLCPRSDAATEKFPDLGDYVPQSFGTDVWDPYVMYMVEQELEQVYHFSQPQIYNGGYVIKTSHRRRQDGARSTRRSARTRRRSTPAPYPFAVLHARRGGAGEPGHRRDRGPVPGPGYPGYKYNGTGPSSPPRNATKINCD